MAEVFVFMLNTRKTYWEDLAAKHNIDPATLFAKAEEEAKAASKSTPTGAPKRFVAQNTVKSTGGYIKVEPETTGKRWGGGLNPDEPFLVGEMGPELIVPTGAGRVFSAGGSQTGNYFNQMQTAMAGATGGESTSVVFAPTSAPVSAPTVVNNMYQMVTQSTYVRKGDGMSRGI